MNVTLSVETAGQRADQFLAARLDGLTRSAAQKLLEEGHVLCQGRPLKKNDRLKPGDQVAVCIPDPTPVELLPQDIPLEVVYEDEDVIVVNKPVGMVVHPAPGHPDGTLVNALLFHCGQSLSGINGQLRPGIVHRIDRDTSGLLIAAKNDGAHLALAQQLQLHILAAFSQIHGIHAFSLHGRFSIEHMCPEENTAAEALRSMRHKPCIGCREERCMLHEPGPTHARGTRGRRR